MHASSYAYFDSPFAALAHRGGSLLPENRGKENTRAAFSNAAALGYRYVETDVHASSDGVLLAFHDAALDRVTDGTGLVAERSAADIATMRVGGSEPIPTLAELLEAFPTMRFNIDIKAAGAIEPLVGLIRSMSAQERVCVASFSRARLRRFRRLMGPMVATSAPPAEVVWDGLIPRLSRWWRTPNVALQIPEFYPVAGRHVRVLTPRLVDAVHTLGKVVHVWDVDDRCDMERMIEMGVDGIVTDRPEVLREVLIERGLWS